MSHQNQLSAAVTAALGLALAATAQDTIPGNEDRSDLQRSLEAPAIVQSDTRVPIHTGEPDGGQPYGIWGVGNAYKASFHDGATFVPYLGKDYPHNQPLTWRTVSASVGALELATQKPELSYTDYRAEYDLGGITEAYDIRADGLEQTFVISSRPAAGGDLVIRGRLDTMLTAKNRGLLHDEILFHDAAGTPILTYGAATAIDGNGDMLPMTSAYDNGTITLRLDGQWLEAARFPVVVDPLLGVVNTVFDLTVEDMDVMRDSFGTSGNNWRAAARWTSANDADAYLRRFNDDGSGDTPVWSDVSTWSTSEVSLGQHRDRAVILLAVTRDLSNGDRRLRLHRRARGDFSHNSNTVLVNNIPEQVQRPDVASDTWAFAPDYLVIVYQAENLNSFGQSTTSQIWGIPIGLGITGTTTPGNPFLISAGLFEDHERPQIGKVRGTGQVWTVAYQVIGSNPLFSSHTDWDVEMVRVDRNGNVTAPKTFGQGNGWHEMSPMLAGYEDDHFLAWAESSVAVAGSKPSHARGMNLRTSRQLWNGSTWTQPHASYRHVPNNDPRAVLTGFDLDTRTGSHAVMAYRSTVTNNVYVRSIGYRGHLLRQETVYNPPGLTTSISGAVAYDDDNDYFLVGYAANENSGSAYTYVDRFAHPTEPMPVTAGLGCSTASLSWDGSMLIGDEGSRLVLSGLPNGALSTILVGTQQFSALLNVAPVHPGCWLLVPNTGPAAIGTLPFGFGPEISYQVDLPEWLDPTTLHFQGVHFDAGATEVFTTQRLSVTFVK